MSRISIDIDLYRQRTGMLTPSLKIDFVELLFMMREGIRVNDLMVTAAYGELKCSMFKLCFDTKEDQWTYPDVEKAIAADVQRKSAGFKRGNTARDTTRDTTRKAVRDTTRVKKDKKTSSPAQAQYTQFVDIYHEWYKEAHGVAPRIDGSDGLAMKRIIKWFAANTFENHTPEEGFSAMLQNWDKLDTFIQNKTRIRDIDSNLNTIITQLKNGKGTNKLTADQEKYLVSRTDL